MPPDKSSAPLLIPERLAGACEGNPERMVWLQQLPGTVRELQRRWSLKLEPPFMHEGSGAWVAPACLTDATTVVLKLGLPHMEGEGEIAGLRFWANDPTVRLIDADIALNAMLLERCVPGHSLRVLAEPEQDAVIAGLLRRMWRRPKVPHPFRPLSVMIGHWIESLLADVQHRPDAGATREGLRLMEELARAAPDDVLLATDLHAGNVLAAQREPWLVIDPKPFVGDRAYDATQHLLNCRERLAADPLGLVARFADLLCVDAQRVRLWTFARLVAEPGDTWQALRAAARLLAPS